VQITSFFHYEMFAKIDFLANLWWKFSNVAKIATMQIFGENFERIWED
jgi:hypothetical protein